MTRLFVILCCAAWTLAADPGPVTAAAKAAPKTKTVLRVDPKTGRLVRSTFALPTPAPRPSVALTPVPAPETAAPAPAVAASSTTVQVVPRTVEPQVVAPISISASGLVAPMPKVPKYTVPPERIRAIVEEKSRQHGLDPLLVHSVIRAESNYNPYAISPKGAEGLMQLIPSTARQYGVRNSFDPEQNIEGGIRYLKYLQTLFTDERLVLAAYNAGEGAVAKYGWIPPYAETQDYVYKVGRYYGLAKREQPPAAAPAPIPSKAAVPAPVLQEFVDGEGRVHITLRQVND